MQTEHPALLSELLCLCPCCENQWWMSQNAQDLVPPCRMLQGLHKAPDPELFGGCPHSHLAALSALWSCPHTSQLLLSVRSIFGNFSTVLSSVCLGNSDQQQWSKHFQASGSSQSNTPGKEKDILIRIIIIVFSFILSTEIPG